MAHPLVRTYDEAMLYLQLQACACGAHSSEWDSALTHDAGRPARRYYTDCGSCETHREFLFRLPERPLLPPPETPVMFGGDEPSELLDAGEWLRVADLCARSAVPVDRDQAGNPRFDPEGEQALAVAIAAMDEVLKFVPFEAEQAPDDAFWSDVGRRVRAQEPGRFELERLGVVRRSYWNQLHAAR